MMQSLNPLEKQERNGLGSIQREEGIQHERRDNYKRANHSSSSGTHKNHSPPYSTRKSYASEDSMSNP